jgi:hypothetical protein
MLTSYQHLLLDSARALSEKRCPAAANAMQHYPAHLLRKPEHAGVIDDAPCLNARQDEQIDRGGQTHRNRPRDGTPRVRFHPRIWEAVRLDRGSSQFGSILFRQSEKIGEEPSVLPTPRR